MTLIKICLVLITLLMIDMWSDINDINKHLKK